MSEILNIDYHTCRLIVKALNVHKKKVRAAIALGIAEKQLYNLIKHYSIYKDKDGYKSPKREFVSVLLMNEK